VQSTHLPSASLFDPFGRVLPSIAGEQGFSRIVPPHSFATSEDPHRLAQSNFSLEVPLHRETICPEVAVDNLSNGSTDVVKKIDALQEATEATFLAGQLSQRTDM
jgi:hypothetical protein